MYSSERREREEALVTAKKILGGDEPVTQMERGSRPYFGPRRVGPAAWEIIDMAHFILTGERRVESDGE